MSTQHPHRCRQPSAAGGGAAVKRPRLIRQASAWLPGRAPEPLPLQDLEQSDAIRWVDIYGGDLRTARCWRCSPRSAAARSQRRWSAT